MANDVWITGIGLISSLGEGLDAHWHALTASPPTPVVDRARFAPYVVHPMAALDLDKQIILVDPVPLRLRPGAECDFADGLAWAWNGDVGGHGRKRERGKGG